jgi:CDP-diacylglycerol--glycerol-3-phosphate 3-phosphatidyltransferase
VKILSSIPNQITLARIASVPLFMFLVLSETTIGTILATVLFSLAAISDAVDGYLARSLKQTSTFGKFADPIADKLLVAGALIAFVQLGELTAAPVMVIIAREFLVTGLRILAIAEGKVIAASSLGKLKTLSHIGLVLAVLVNRYFQLGSAGATAKDAFLYLAIALALISGGEYFYRSRSLFS